MKFLKQNWIHTVLLLVIVGMSISVLSYFLWRTQKQPVFSPIVRALHETLIIDAGHGGEDGGAVSYTGVPESGINLSIAQKMDQLLGMYGVSPYLLRKSDISLHNVDAQTLREKKVSDLHNRVSKINSFQNATLISIHQNTYQNQQYHGAQVFYADEKLSLAFAKLTQEVLRQVLDPQNTRSPAKIPKSIYLMNHISCQAILVECGFLSNPLEDKLLQTASYQTKISIGLVASWLQLQANTLEIK